MSRSCPLLTHVRVALEHARPDELRAVRRLVDHQLVAELAPGDPMTSTPPSPAEIRARAWLLVDAAVAFGLLETREGVVVGHTESSGRYYALAPGQPRVEVSGRSDAFTAVERLLTALVPA